VAEPIRPLDGVRVVDLSQVEFGPICTQFLGDFGADVIKVERMGKGDIIRWNIEDKDGPDNPIFLSINRNKRSIELDLKKEEGQEVVHALVRTADVIVNNFRLGVMERLNLGYEQLRGINARLVYAYGTGFGSTGPYANKAGQDVLAQAMTGPMARRADPSHPLAIYGTSLADYTAGMLLFQGILLALLARNQTGVGQKVEVSLYDGLLAMQHQEATMWTMRQIELNWSADPLAGVFETQDGAIVIIGAFKDNPLRDISKALGLDDLSAIADFATYEAQTMNKSKLQKIWADRIRTNTTDHWLHELDGVDILCGPVVKLKDALSHPQVAANGMLWTLPHPLGGDLVTIGQPVKLSGTPAGVRYRPPRLGEHTVEILSDVGYSSEQIASLREAGAIK
jgi:crotonobetainyl-CoA:carnitine CoA-transferase CaiB-like acyl-CoA transferase